MTSILILLLTVVAGAAGFGIIARALPWPHAWTLKKPLACPACMSGWGGFAVLGLWWWAGVELPAPLWALLWLAAIGGGAPVFRSVYPPVIELDIDP